MGRGQRDGQKSLAKPRERNALQPRREPPERVETSEEAKEKLELMVESLQATGAELAEHYADDSVLNRHLNAATLAVREAVARLEALEENRSPEGQAKTIAATALRRYADIDDGEAIGGRADASLQAELAEQIAALAHYADRRDVDGDDALIALDRIKELGFKVE